MKALVLVGNKKIGIKEIETPKPKENEVLLKIRASGICTNDIRDYKGESNYTLPRIGGHEYSGEIVELGKNVDKNQFSIGQHAVSYIIPACGECYYCHSGQENLCEKVPLSKTFYNSEGISGYCGFAEYITINTKDLYILPKEVSFEIAAFAEPIACVMNSLDHAKIEMGDDVVIIGGGVMGLLHVILSKMRGARVILSEPNEKRRELAKKYGCDITFDPFEKEPLEYVKEITSGRGAKIVFNTTAISTVAEQAISMTSPGGKCLMFSSIHPNKPINLDAGLIHSKEKIITGSVSPTIQSFNKTVEILSKNLIDPTDLIHKIYPYTEAIEAFEEASKPDTLKTIIKFD